MNVSAIIPVWNGRDLLKKLLDSLHLQTLPFAEILVVDNGSADGAPEMAEEQGARVIRLHRNTGFAHAVNCGVLNASYDTLAILNSDVELHSDWLQILSDKGAPFATGKILSAARPQLLDGAFDLLCRGGCAWRAGSGKPDIPGALGHAVIAATSLTAALITKQTFRTVGPLDERFESYLEDVDFGIRCAACGIQGAFVPEAICWHHGSASLGRWHAASVRRISRNQVFIVAKHYPAPLIRRWLWPILAAQGLWGLVALRHGAGWAWLAGKWEGLRNCRRSGEPVPEALLRSSLVDQEQALYRLQCTFGMDSYWRIYFALCGEPAGAK